MFRSVNALMQGFGCVLFQDLHCTLAHDRPGIHPGIHKMNRATGHLHTVVQRLFPRLKTWKGWQK